MTIYYLILASSFVAALWLNAGALAHILLLAVWWFGCAWLDSVQAYELKLFLDFAGMWGVVVLTIGRIMKGHVSKGEAWCGRLAMAQVVVSALCWGLSHVFRAARYPYEVFNVMTIAYGWTLSLLFLGSVLVLLWGVDVRSRVGDFLDSLRGLRVRYSGLFPTPKAHVARSGLEDGLERRVQETRSDLHIPASVEA